MDLRCISIFGTSLDGDRLEVEVAFVHWLLVVLEAQFDECELIGEGVSFGRHIVDPLNGRSV